MFTTVVFGDITDSTTLRALTAIPDPTHYTSGDDLAVGKLTSLFAAYARAFAIGNAYLVSPSLRAKWYNYISPLVNDMGGYAQYIPHRIDDRRDSPIALVTSEMLNAYLSQTVADASEANIIAVWLSDSPIVPIKGEIITTNAYASGLTLPLNVWTSSELTWAQDLPAGRYQIVGARAYIVNGGVFRFVPREAMNRPGGVAIHEKAFVSDPCQRKGYWGVWLEFDHTLPPQIEILPNKAGDTEIYMRIDLIKVG